MRSAATRVTPVKPQSSPIVITAPGLRVASTTGWLGARGLLAGHERKVTRCPTMMVLPRTACTIGAPSQRQPRPQTTPLVRRRREM